MLGMLRAARGEVRLDLRAVDDQRVGRGRACRSCPLSPFVLPSLNSALSSTTISPALALAESA